MQTIKKAYLQRLVWFSLFILFLVLQFFPSVFAGNYNEVDYGSGVYGGQDIIAATTSSTIETIGGGGAVEEKAAETQIIARVTENMPVIVRVSEPYKTGVNEIIFTAAEDISNVKITISKLTSKPAEATEPYGMINSYLQFDAPKLKDKLKEAKIKFEVEKAWLNEVNAMAEEIVLQRFADAGWRGLTTIKLKEDSAAVYYEAISPGFSLFAITAKEKIEIKEEQQKMPEEEIKEKLDEMPAEPATAKKIKSRAWLYMLSTAIIAAIVAAFLFARKRRNILRNESTKSI